VPLHPYTKQAVRETGKVPWCEALEGITEVGLRIEKKRLDNLWLLKKKQ
jgi:hypothetical protein